MPVCRMVVPISGPSYSLGPGDCHTFTEAEAERLVKAGFAVALEPPQPAAAVQPAKRERAVARKPARAPKTKRKNRKRTAR